MSSAVQRRSSISFEVYVAKIESGNLANDVAVFTPCIKALLLVCSLKSV